MGLSQAPFLWIQHTFCCVFMEADMHETFDMDLFCLRGQHERTPNIVLCTTYAPPPHLVPQDKQITVPFPVVLPVRTLSVETKVLPS